MARVNLILLAAVLICALAAVTTNHRARKLIIEYERETKRMQALDVEWGQLQLEQSTWATHARVEEISRHKLAMHPPRPAQILSITP